MTQSDCTTVDVNTVFSDIVQLQIFNTRQRLSSECFVQFPVVDVSYVQASTLQCFFGRRNRTVAHDRSINTSNRHTQDTSTWLQTQFLSFFVAHQQHRRRTIGDLRRSTRSYGTCFRIECRTQFAQAFRSSFRTNGFVFSYQDFFTVSIVTVHRHDFVFEVAVQSRSVSATVRTCSEFVLLLTGNAVHFTQHFSRQTHHVRCFRRELRRFRVMVETVLHVYVAHVLNTTNNEYIAVTSLNRLSCSVDCRHCRTTQTVNSLCASFFRHNRGQRDLTRYVEALFQSLVYTAPDYVFYQRRVYTSTLEHSIDQVCRNGLCTYVAEYTTFGTTHW